MLIQGESRNGVLVQLDQCFTNTKGDLQAKPVMTVLADDVVLLSMTLWNLANEPGGCGGKWDFAVQTVADRVILNDLFLRADHDTLIVYGNRFRVYVYRSHIQGRGDFIASFSSTFIEDSVLETIRDRGHFLFQAGEPGLPLEEQEVLVVRDTVFTGQTQGTVWPFGVTSLWGEAVLYLIENAFEYDAGANRPILFYHDAVQPQTSTTYRFGNSQNHFTIPLIWNEFSVPGPIGNPRLDFPIAEGPPFVHSLTQSEADAVQPDMAFWGWDARGALESAAPYEVPAITAPGWLMGFVALALLAAPSLRTSGLGGRCGARPRRS